MGNYGFKVSKSGESVITGGDDDFVFSSGFDNLIRKSTGTASITVSTTVAHGLGYKPIFFGIYSRDGDNFKMGNAGVDDTNIVLDVYDASFPVDWRYYIFYHTGV